MMKIVFSFQFLSKLFFTTTDDVLVTLNVISNSDVNNIYQTPLTSTDYFLNQLMTVFFSRSMDIHMEGV